MRFGILAIYMKQLAYYLNHHVLTLKLSAPTLTPASTVTHVCVVGVLQPALTDSFIYNVRQQLGETMMVSPIRIQDVRVDYDMADVYVLASLLDRTSPTGYLL